VSDEPIYLDYNATTPLDPQVLEAMLPFLEREYGNPSSSHALGRRAHRAVERARTQVAKLIGARPDEIVFTGCGSESNNLAIKGVVLAALLAGDSHLKEPHLVTSAVEHPAVLEPCRFLERAGCRVTVVPVDRCGLVDPDAVARALDAHPGARLVSIMHANNEVGTIEPIAEIAAICKEHGVLLHTDAAQSVGKMRVRVKELGVDLLTIAGHKLYAPKGIGALYVRRGVKLEPVIHGAAHEGGRRAGTENVPYIVGFGAACARAGGKLERHSGTLRALRDRLEQRLREGLGEALVLNGHRERRLPNTLNVNFPGRSGQEVLDAAPEVAASTGSACHSGQVTLSPVLAAMGVPPEVGRGAVRLSVGRFTTEEETDRAASALLRACVVRK
jgi:cysteine desulfurase